MRYDIAPQYRDKQWGRSAVQHGSLSLCSLLAANSQISVPIGQKMQLTGCDYGNDMRNAICMARWRFQIIYRFPLPFHRP